MIMNKSRNSDEKEIVSWKKEIYSLLNKLTKAFDKNNSLKKLTRDLKTIITSLEATNKINYMVPSWRHTSNSRLAQESGHLTRSVKKSVGFTITPITTTTTGTSDETHEDQDVIYCCYQENMNPQELQLLTPLPKTS